MTVSSTLEAKLRERGSSSAPADAAGKVLGVQPRDEEGQARFSNIVHWAYGTSWGAVRGLLHALTCRRSGGERQPAYASHTGGLPADDMPAARCGGWAMSRR